jgi:hypothetical protein
VRDTYSQGKFNSNFEAYANKMLSVGISIVSVLSCDRKWDDYS